MRVCVRRMALLVAMLAMADSAWANVCHWTGQGTTNLWSNPNNWTGCGPANVPVNGDEVLFEDHVGPTIVAQTTNVNDIAGLTLLGLFIDEVALEAVIAAPGATVANDTAATHYDISGLAVTVSGGFGAAMPHDPAGPIVRMDVTVNGIDVDTDTTLTLTGRIGGLGPSLFKTGPGVAVLAGPSMTWNALVIRAGTAKVGAQNAIPATAMIVFPPPPPNPVPPNPYATFDLNGMNVTVQAVTDGDGARVQLGSGTLTINQTDTNFQPAYFGTIAGTGKLVKTGAGSFEMDGTVANTYTGTTTVQAGDLRLESPVANGNIISALVINGGSVSAGDQIGDQAAVTVNQPGVLFIDAPGETIGSLSGDGLVNVRMSTLSVGGANGQSTFSGTITGQHAPAGLAVTAYYRLVKVGTGSFTLTGTSNLADVAVVMAGTLLVDGQVNAISTIVNNGGVIGGTGAFVNADDPQSINQLHVHGGTISPGHSPGVLHGDAADISDGGSLVIELNGVAAGTGYDQLQLRKSLTLSADTQLVVTRGFDAPKDSVFKIVDLQAGATLTGTFAGLPEGATLAVANQHFRISYQNGVTLTAVDDPPPPTYYLSEGATGPFFDEDILIANPSTTAAPVTLTFSKEDGSQVVSTATVPAQARLTVHVDTIPGLENTSASAQVRSDARLPLVVERTMFWDQTHYAGSTGSAVDTPGPDWFFAEGSQGFFQTFVLVNNPNATPATVTFTFFRENDTPVVRTLTVQPTTRLTLDCGTIPEIVNRSFGIAVHASLPIMAERSMYFGTTPTRLWSGGTESAGVQAASTHWFLAEGATGGFFYTYVLLSNPEDEDARVIMTYLLPTGETIDVHKIVPAHTRLTTNIGVEDDVRLHNTAVSTIVTSSEPIIAERSMYWPTTVLPWGEGHNSFGVVDAGLKWGLSEGRTGGPFNYHTYILLANPQLNDAAVTVTFLRENGAPLVKTYTVPARSRFNIDSAALPELHDESFGAVIEVTNGMPVIVERSLYWDLNGISFSGGTNATGIPLP